MRIHLRCRIEEPRSQLFRCSISVLLVAGEVVCETQRMNVPPHRRNAWLVEIAFTFGVGLTVFADVWEPILFARVWPPVRAEREVVVLVIARRQESRFLRNGNERLGESFIGVFDKLGVCGHDPRVLRRYSCLRL